MISDKDEKAETCGRITCNCTHDKCDRGWVYVSGDPFNGVPDTVQHCYVCGGARRQRTGESRTDWLGRLQTPMRQDPENGEVPPPPAPFILNRRQNVEDRFVSNPTIMVSCPFCKAPPGGSCTVTGTNKTLRHRRYHPSRYELAGVDMPPVDLEKMNWDDPLTTTALEKAFAVASAAETEESDQA